MKISRICSKNRPYFCTCGLAQVHTYRNKADFRDMCRNKADLLKNTPYFSQKSTLFLCVWTCASPHVEEMGLFPENRPYNCTGQNLHECTGGRASGRTRGRVSVRVDERVYEWKYECTRGGTSGCTSRCTSWYAQVWDFIHAEIRSSF